jgi:amino acid adenylation domain-containing protein
MNDFSKRSFELSEEKRALLEALMEDEGLESSPTPKISPAMRTGPAPLSFAQQRLWFLDQLEPGNAHYNIPVALRLGGRLHVPSLEQSINAIIRRHEVLRTHFEKKDGEPVQVVDPAGEMGLPVIDLGGLEPGEQEAECQGIVEREVLLPFELLLGPMLRARLIRLAEQDHVLLLTMHHIASDGWSLGVLLRELATFYEAFSSGKSSPLPDLPIQYADFAQWQRQSQQGKMLEKSLAYWRKQLADLSPLRLPTDRPRPARQSYRGAAESVLLPEALTQALRDLSLREGGTLFMTLLAAFQTLLYRYCGQEDIVIGSPIANRSRTETEPLIGFFVNNLVVRMDFSGRPTFREVLKRMQEVLLGAYTHQDLPFEKLVEELHPERSLSQNPLFQVMFILQDAQWEQPTKLPALTVTPMPVAVKSTHFDLDVYFCEKIDGLHGSFVYSTDLFEAATVRRMTTHFRKLLEEIVADPGRSVAALPLLPQAEHKCVVEDWNETARDYPLHRTLHQMIESQVDRAPEAIALVFEEESLTYRELNARANQLAHHLISVGTGPETLVGICMHRSIEMVVGLLGILKAGAAYVPMDPEYPRERLEYMVQDAGVPVLLTQQHLVSRLPEHSSHLICLDTQWDSIRTQSRENPDSRGKPEHLAYMIYTSGSTGKPKGAMNVHRGICNRLLWMQEAYHLTEKDRVLQKTPFSFDVSVWEFFWPLMTGAQLIVARPEGHKDAAYLVRLIREQGITTIHFVPSMLEVFLREKNVEDCTSLRQVFCSGEALSYELQELYFRRLPAELHNLYGPTEASVDVTYWACKRGDPRRIVPIGRPIANTQIYILDTNLEPMPIGIPGELHIGGIGLARGYHNRPELTAEKFIANPLGKGPGSRLYKTGDLARFLEDGQIEYLGRMDGQIKIRGFRIELGEIESALRKHPAVRDTVVIAREDSPGDKRLAAYVVPQAERSFQPRELRDYLSRSLPEYMIPSAFVTLPALPLSANGKVERRALPKPDETSRASSGSHVLPRNSLEQTIVKIWEELLQTRNVGVLDNFFEIGGNSLLLVQVHEQLRHAVHREFPLIELFNHPTITSIAEYLSQESGRGVDSAHPAAQTSAKQEDLHRLRRAFQQRRNRNS